MGTGAEYLLLWGVMVEPYRAG